MGGGMTVKVESKEDVCEKLGRSTDRGDSVVMCWSAGTKNENVRGGFALPIRRNRPVVIMGHQAARRRTAPQSGRSSGGEHG